MADLVLFRLEAPIAAFGELAVGERRGSARRPAHSAIAGLLAAALGLGRSDPGHEALATSFWLAVRTDRIGAPLADFHTAQTPPQRRGRQYPTRKAELAVKNDLGTIVSRRDYWTDVACTVLIWPKPGSPQDPAGLAAALNRPAFAPFLGRRCCPLGAPVAARVITAADLPEAFTLYDAWQRERRAATPGLPPISVGAEVAVDAVLWERQGRPGALRFETCRDALASRSRWQFHLREEAIIAWPRAPLNAAKASGDGAA
jgi:CRISPR system Cascade subunit CasD